MIELGLSRQEKRELSPKKVVIFDFDGTIADSRDELGRIINKLAPEYDYPLLDESKMSEYTNKSAREFVRKDLDLSIFKIPGFTQRMQTKLNKKVPDLKPFDGIAKVIQQLKTRDYKIGIISSNSEENIKLFLENHGLDVFDFVRSGSSVFGKHRHIKSVAREMGLNLEEAVYVGDEIRDMDASSKAGIDIIVVTWGYNSKESLEKKNPEFIVNSPSEILDLLPKK